MKLTRLSEVARLAGGTLIKGDPNLEITEVCTDTRNLPEGSLFVALVGEKFDAHDFLCAAAGKASACLVSRVPSDLDAFPAAVIEVGDTLTGLQQLASGYREALDFPVVCVTGSNGKTSTKDFLAAVLGRRFSVNATRGNFNNHIGLPLSILRTGSEHDCAVWELGMSNPGEIASLAAMARPTVGVITNVGTAHIEFMKSREAIAHEKGMLAEAVRAEGLVVLNASDDYTPLITERTKARVLTAGIGEGDCQAQNVDCGAEGSSFEVNSFGSSFTVSLPVPGRHMVSNAILAIAVGLELGAGAESIVAGLASASITGGRLQFRTVQGVRFIDDSYNANPDSMRAALATLANAPCKGRRIAVLGRMAELGEHARSEHESIGAVAHTEFGVDVLLTVGSEAAFLVDGFRGAGGSESASDNFESHEQCAQRLFEIASPDDLVLVKGSRSSAMEQVMKSEEAPV